MTEREKIEAWTRWVEKEIWPLHRMRVIFLALGVMVMGAGGSVALLWEGVPWGPATAMLLLAGLFYLVITDPIARGYRAAVARCLLRGAAFWLMEYEEGFCAACPIAPLRRRWIVECGGERERDMRVIGKE